MKRFGVALVSVLVLMVGVLSAPTTAQAYMVNGSSGWRLTVTPDATAVGFALSTPGYSEDDDTYDDMKVRLTGPAGFAKTLYGWEWPSFNAPFASMPRGVYTLTATYSEAAHWHCSQFNPNGCSWWEADRHTARFKFRWNGTAVRVSPYRLAPIRTSMKVVKAPKKAKTVTVKGRVKGQQRRTSDSQPAGSFRPVRGLKVQLQWWDFYEWKTAKTVRTKADGSYKVRARKPKRDWPKNAWWRVRVVGGDEYKSYTSKKFKR